MTVSCEALGQKISKHVRQRVDETPSWKFLTHNSAGGVAQELEHLPSKNEALNSNPVPPK
jgi:hypothetical protein